MAIFYPFLHYFHTKEKKTDSENAHLQLIIYRGGWQGTWKQQRNNTGALDGQIICMEQEHISSLFLTQKAHLSCFIVGAVFSKGANDY